MQNFIDNLNSLLDDFKANESEYREILDKENAAKERQNEISAGSGGNVTWVTPVLSKNYADTLNDAIRFYQNEFKITPHAMVYSDWEELNQAPGYTTGITFPADKTGQSPVNLRYMDEWGEKEGEQIAKESEAEHWHPKNAKTIGDTPIHEFGHVLHDMLFPYEDTSSNKSDMTYRNLTVDALTDLGVQNNDEAMEKVGEISEYAKDNPAETIAEALVDYYYNRNHSADLSKAIVKRLKSNSSTYGLRQAGGFDMDPSADNFIKNLRRYRVIQ